MGKQEFAERLLELLVTELPKDSAEIQEAVDRGDFECAARLAHRLKGAAANMCAEDLSRAAALMEQRARASAAAVSEADGFLGSWEELQRQIQLVIQELRP